MEAAAAAYLIVPLAIHQHVEECLQWIQYGDDVPTYDNDMNWQMEPHCPHKNSIHDIWQPADIKDQIYQREFDFEHIVDLPLIVSVGTIPLNQLSVHFFAALHIQDWVGNHYNQNWTIVEHIVRHHSQ